MGAPPPTSRPAIENCDARCRPRITRGQSSCVSRHFFSFLFLSSCCILAETLLRPWFQLPKEPCFSLDRITLGLSHSPPQSSLLLLPGTHCLEETLYQGNLSLHAFLRSGQGSRKEGTEQQINKDKNK